MAVPIEYVIRGSRIDRTEDFWVAIGAAVNGPEGYFGQSLDGLADCLRGGFGTPDDGGFRFTWTESYRSRVALGYPETVRQLSLRLEQCHPTSSERVRGELIRARQRTGPTVLDWIVQVFRDEGVPLTLR